MKRVLQVLVVLAVVIVSLCIACRHPTDPDPNSSREACVKAGGQWGPWIDHYGCKLPEKKS